MTAAIVLGCHYNGLAVIQSLGRRGVECTAMDFRRGIGTWSRYARWVACPDPARRESDFVAFLMACCRAHPTPPVVFPTGDAWAMALARHAARFDGVAHLCVSSWDTVQTVLEKDRFHRFASNLGCAIPRVWTLESLAKAGPDAFPIAARPICRVRASDSVDEGLAAALMRLRLTPLETPRALERFVEREAALLPHLFFTDLVPGRSDHMRTIGVCAHEGELLGVFMGRKVRGYPADIGDCVVGEVCGLPTVVLEEVRRLSAALSLSGIAEFEYKRDPHTGRHWLIEINPRSWSWIGIAPACGVDLVALAYQALSGVDLGVVGGSSAAVPDGSVRYIKVLEDLPNVLFRYRRDHSPWVMGPLQWGRELLGRRVVVAELSADDVSVAAVALWRRFTGL